MKVEAFDAPFRHWLLHDILDAPLARAAFDATPASDWPGWEARYDNDCERGKRTSRPAAGLPAPWPEVFAALERPGFVARLADLSGVPSLRADSSNWGAGCHVTDPHGWLNCHLDYSLHPSGLERRLSLVLFLNPTWRRHWGGAFELWDESARSCVKRITPAFNAAVVFEGGDLSYHGAEQTAADAPPRVTATCYFLADARPGVMRRRALYIPRRGA